MSRDYKNVLNLRERTFGYERRKNLTKEVVQDATPLPMPLEYEDIDKEFIRWVDEDLKMNFDGVNLPTYTFLSNQRFSEYLQSWQNVDEKKNLVLNFKSITRENNPKSGTIVGDTKNIPGSPDFLMKRVPAVGKAGNRYFIEYRTKQPIPIDLIYTVSVFTNKYELLNKFNQLVNSKFQAIDCYIRPNGHFIPMKLDDISDESEYSIDNRRFYSQSYAITVMGYIMPKEGFSTVEVPYLTFDIFDGSEKKKTYAEIEELPCKEDEDLPYGYENVLLTVNIPSCSNKGKFVIDCDFKATAIKLTNVKYFKLFVNDTRIEISDDYDFLEKLNEFIKTFELKKGDEVKITGVSKNSMIDDAKIEITGYDYTNVVPIENRNNTNEIEINEKC